MVRRTSYFTTIFLLGCLFSINIFAQPTWTLDPFGNEKKPEKFEDKLLGSEKTATKKFGFTRHFVQNTVSHYNFYYNANTKLNTVIERATLAQKDDYSKLLPFYPYSLDNTASQKVDLDTVIYKCTAGILLHDLRSDWVDNFYMMIGKSYFLQKKFDSALMTFQFINYNLFPRKKGEDDGRLVGTNTSASYNVLSISNKEKRNLAQKILTLPPSRNDALIWLTHTLIDQKEYGDASELINILQYDPKLPQRLRNDLEIVTSYWFYKQKYYDSAAAHLEKGISAAENKQDKARWEYLAAQLYEISGDNENASKFYNKAIKHTTDPLLDIYARLNDAKMYKNTGNEKELQKSVDKLLKMAKKDKFESFRDIIYYYSGQLNMQRLDTVNAIAYFEKSIKYNEDNALFRDKSYLKLGNLSYSSRKYEKALSYYDSLDTKDSLLKEELVGIEDRRNSLRALVKQTKIISREDSLQLIAAMDPAERDALIKKLVKKYRNKDQAIEEESFAGNSNFNSTIKDGDQLDIFKPTGKGGGEWYFYNAGVKSKGFSEFKSKWGKRENVDNWRRRTAMDAAFVKSQNGNIDIDEPLAPVDSSGLDSLENSRPVENSYDGYMSNLPLTKEKLDSSNNKMAKAYVKLAKVFQYELEDYQQAIDTYDAYLKRFPDRLLNGEIYLGYYYCYTKLGNASRAAYYKNLLSNQFADSRSSLILTNPDAAEPNKKNPAVTQRYERIYEMFIEGDFQNAVIEKTKADSLYGKNYWTPQLLYIESINYIKNRQDSEAIVVLENVVSLYPNSPLKPKAETMIDVLKRRSEIEAYLTNLEVKRVAEEGRVMIAEDKAVSPIRNESKPTEIRRIEGIKNISIQKDSIQMPASMISGTFSWRGEKPHFVVMILNKVDAVYIKEGKIAFDKYNKDYFASKRLTIVKDQLDADRTLLVTTSFENADDAVLYYDKIKKAAASEVSWLAANKYSFLVISESNLKLLKENKDITTYKVLLNNQYPGKF